MWAPEPATYCFGEKIVFTISKALESFVLILSANISFEGAFIICPSCYYNEAVDNIFHTEMQAAAMC